MRKLIDSKPMAKWCDDCDKFKPNPERAKHPKYCSDCRKRRLRKGRIKANQTIALRRQKNK